MVRPRRLKQRELRRSASGREWGPALSEVETRKFWSSHRGSRERSDRDLVAETFLQNGVRLDGSGAGRHVSDVAAHFRSLKPQKQINPLILILCSLFINNTCFEIEKFDNFYDLRTSEQFFVFLLILSYCCHSYVFTYDYQIDVVFVEFLYFWFSLLLSLCLSCS